MIGTATTAGGAHHGLAVLTHGEREAAQNALAKLRVQGRGLGSLDSSTRSATVHSGSALKSTGLNASLLHGQGHDTFIGGARSGLSHVQAGNDTVVSGSTASAFTGRTWDALAGQGHHFTLSADTISVAGATAESVKAGSIATHSHASHTITLADKTTIKITGVSTHDISKLSH
jgi:Ca2+-binding RTX toxin-like protein